MIRLPIRILAVSTLVACTVQVRGESPAAGSAPQLKSVKPDTLKAIAKPVPIPSPAAGAKSGAAGGSAAALDQAARTGQEAQAARQAAAARESMNALRQAGDGKLNLDLKDAGGGAGGPRPGFDPTAVNRLRNLPAGQDSAGQLEGLNQRLGLGSNRDEGKPGQSGPGGAVSAPDPGGMLSGAKGGLASETVSVGQGNIGQVKTVDHSDGTRTTTYHREELDGSSRQDEITTQAPNGLVKESTIITRFRDGSTWTSTATRQSDGTYVNTSRHLSREGHLTEPTVVWRSPTPHANVDPDAPTTGGASGVQPHGAAKGAKDPKAVTARDRGVGPGARPDENRAGGAVPRLTVDDLGTVVNPPPVEQQGGGTPNRGFNPNDFKDPPRPTP